MASETTSTPSTQVLKRRGRPSEEADVADSAPVETAPAQEVDAVPERPATPPQTEAELAAEFERLLADSGRMMEWKVGDRVRGVVVSMNDEAVFVDLGGKCEAWIERRELLDAEGNLTVPVGQELEAQVISASGDSLRLSHGAIRAQMLSELLEQAAETGLPVEGKVIGHNEGGLEVRVGGRRAFCPRSQIDRDFTEGLEGYVGQTLEFLVTRFDPTGRKIVLSRRALLEREAKSKAEETRKTLAEGAVVTGVVRKVMEFGAFVDVGGLDGLVHVSELSWNRVEHPKEVVREGQEVRVKVLKFDPGKDRIGLSMKQAEDDPWEGVGTTWEVSRTYPGKVTRLQPFGAFIEVGPGVEGLVHVSEIDWSRRIAHPQDVLKVGQDVEVLILEADRKRKRLSLSIKQAAADPWSTAVAGLTVGSSIEVAVEKVTDFGVFCTLAPGVSGLMPASQTDKERGANLRREFPVATKIQVNVLEIDKKARKITLSRRAAAEGGETADYRAWQKEQKRQEKAAPAMSALALAFAAAQEKKKGKK